MSIPQTAKPSKITVFAGSRLRDLREARGFTFAALGQLIEVTDESIRLWETGRATPNGSKIARLASVLGCTPNDFFVTHDLSS